MSAAGEPPPAGLAGTKLEIVEAATKTLKAKGFAGTSAREIARTGSFNQALIFYHFGNLRAVLLAAFDLVSARRMESYGPALGKAQTIAELASLARKIYADDLEHGYVTVLGEMVAAGASDAKLGREVVARVEPWIEILERKLRDLLGSPPAAIVPARDVAFAIVALYLGIDMLSHLEGSSARPEALLDLCVSLAPLLASLLPTRPRSRSR